MTVQPKTNLQARAEQIRNETAGFANDGQRVGGLLRDIVDSGASVVDVTSYGASPTNTAAGNDAAIALAIAAAIAGPADLYWPAGTYQSAGSIANLHAVRHRGPGVIQRGSDLFYVEPKYGQTNRLYVSTSGSAGNDGLSSSQPTTLAQAASNLRNYGPVLNGSWKVIGAAGTYSVNSASFDTPSRDWLVIQGPDVGGHPNVPTMIVDGTGAGANKFGFLISPGGAMPGVQTWFQDVKCQNFNNGTQNSGGWALTYGGRAIFVNCHAFNCDFGGIVADTADNCLVKGGIYDTCRSGIIANNTPMWVGYQAASTADGPIIQNCTQNGVYWSRGAQNHSDFAIYKNNPYHVQVESASRVHLMGNDFRTATIAAVSTNTDGSYYDDVSTPNNYNDGTGNANAKRYDHFAYTGEQQKVQQVSRSWCQIFSDTTTRTLTNAARTQIGADITCLNSLLYYFTSEGTRIKIVVRGTTPAAATNIGFDFFASVGSVTTIMDDSASTGVPGAVDFRYECEICPSAVAVQRTFATFSVSNLGVREQDSGTAANMALAQTIRLMGKSTSGQITVRRVEVWVLG